jgi:PqqD family protein of HPr-rel-A system
VADPVYTADASEGLLHVGLDTLTALYHRRSGITHIVSEPVPQIIAALAGQSRTLDDLIATLSRDHDVQGGAETRAALTARLDELKEVGLVSRG